MNKFDVASKFDCPSAATVDAVIQSHVGNLLQGWRSPLLSSMFHGLVRAIVDRDAAIKFLDVAREMSTDEFVRYYIDFCSLTSRVYGLENVPRAGRLLVVSNHPMGVIDDAIMWNVLKRIRPDVVLLSSAAALDIVPNAEDAFIPKELHRSRLTPKTEMRMAAPLNRALRAGSAMVVMPSGGISVCKDGRLVEEEWSPMFALIAQKHCVPIVPAYIDGRNSFLHYFLCRISPKLGGLTVFREILNKRRQDVAVEFGPALSVCRMHPDPDRIVSKIKSCVMDDLAEKLYQRKTILSELLSRCLPHTMTGGLH